MVSPHISSFSKEIAEQDNSYNYTLNLTERKTVGDNSCKKICASLNLNDKTIKQELQELVTKKVA